MDMVMVPDRYELFFSTLKEPPKRCPQEVP